jgi:hypothetical protein
MLLRLKLYRLLIKLAVYPLPFAAFSAAFVCPQILCSAFQIGKQTGAPHPICMVIKTKGLQEGAVWN